MKVERFTVENYRSIDRLEVDFSNDLVILVGENNAGKTNIVRALEHFFKTPKTSEIDEQFFHLKETTRKIDITVWFGHLSEADKRVFKKYVLEDQVIVRREISLKDDEVTTEVHGVVGRDPNGNYEFSETKFEGFQKASHPNMPEFLPVPAIRDISEQTGKASSVLTHILDQMIRSIPRDRLRALEEVASRAAKMVNKIDGAEGDRIGSLKSLEQDLSEMLRELMPRTSLSLGYANLFSPAMLRTPNITVDDGIETDVKFKGQGLQSTLFFTLFRFYAEKILKMTSESGDKRPLIFAIEEPELYLHPHIQRVMLSTLQNISAVDQVILSTHSPYMIDMLRHDTLAVARKEGVATRLTQTRAPVLSSKDKEYFKLLTQFDPVKNELFFARKVIFVEGPCDRYAVLLSAGLLNKALDEKCITVTDCGSKDSMPFFLMIANAFKIPYSIMFDTDSDRVEGPGKSKLVKDAVDPNLCISIQELEPRLEVELGLKSTEKLHPLDVIRMFQRLGPQQVPAKIRKLVETTTS